MRIDITPDTPEADLRKLIARSYVQQTFACLVAAAMALNACAMLSMEITALSILSAGFSVLAMYYSYRVFHFTAQMRAALRHLIELQSLRR